MATITIVEGQNERTANVPDDQRLVLAIEAQGVNIGHRCGGNARCTTCRVEILDGEPDTMTKAEFDILRTRGIYGQARLSCQLVADHDMRVRPLMTKETEGLPGTGPHPSLPCSRIPNAFLRRSSKVRPAPRNRFRHCFI